MYKIVPSIASCNLMNVEKELLKANESENLHVDIEDGNFVPNITFGIKFIKRLRSITSKPFSVHLMVTDPKLYLAELSNLNCSHIFIHAENDMYLRRSLNLVKGTGSKVGLAINPISNIKDYSYCFDLIDSILYMTSEPDGLSEEFISTVIPKLITVEEKEIWIDGGVTIDVINKLEHLNIDYYVMGRAFFE